MKIDMHTHTIYSDGMFSPKKLVDKAFKLKLDGIAISDHDSVGGIDEAIEASKEYENFQLITSIEFSSSHKEEEVHILGYFIDYESKILNEYVNHLRKERISRAEKIYMKLKKLGIEISMEKIYSNKLVSRSHIAKELVENKYSMNIDEAFDKYLSIGRPAYVSKDSLKLYDTIKLVKKLNGIPVLAHPGLLKKEQTLRDSIDLGILGIECIHSKHSQEFSKKLIKYSKENKMIITGGSDCHGQLIEGELLLGKYFWKIEKGDILYEYLQG